MLYDYSNSFMIFLSKCQNPNHIIIVCVVFLFNNDKLNKFLWHLSNMGMMYKALSWKPKESCHFPEQMLKVTTAMAQVSQQWGSQRQNKVGVVSFIFTHKTKTTWSTMPKLSLSFSTKIRHKRYSKDGIIHYPKLLLLLYLREKYYWIIM